MKDSKMDKSYSVLSYNVIEIIFLSFGTLFIIIMLIFVIREKNQFSFEILICVVFMIFSITVTISRIIVDDKCVLDSDGFSMIVRNRITAKEIKKFYRWDDIQSMWFTYRHLLRFGCKTFINIKYKKKTKTEEIQVSSFIQESKFVKLARQYSGRENIVKVKKKRKPFEKDW